MDCHPAAYLLHVQHVRQTVRTQHVNIARLDVMIVNLDFPAEIDTNRACHQIPALKKRANSKVIRSATICSCNSVNDRG